MRERLGRCGYRIKQEIERPAPLIRAGVSVRNKVKSHPRSYYTAFHLNMN